ncbi:MAG: hypothetical protein KDI38_03610 [Calditrichaeota bacterium]|nr:hypothetical protein [Calditrichota bacterium]
MFAKIKYILPFVLFLAVAFQSSGAFAALADSSNHAVSVRETDTHIIYYGTLNFSTADSTSSLFTKALDMYWVDVLQPIILTVHGNSSAAAQDVNMFIEGAPVLVDSLFENTYISTTFDDVDLYSGDGVVRGIINHKILAKDSLVVGAAAAAGRTYPDVGIATLDPAFLNRYIRVEADGQAGNRSDVVVKWWLECPKKAGAPRNGAYGVFSVAGGL